jgi:hypothetical protein
MLWCSRSNSQTDFAMLPRITHVIGRADGLEQNPGMCVIEFPLLPTSAERSNVRWSDREFAASRFFWGSVAPLN